MRKKNEEFHPEDEKLEELETEINDEMINDQIIEEEMKEPLFPFDKMFYQEMDENIGETINYEMGSDEELNLGESDKRAKKRSLKDERGAGYEP